VGGVSCRRVRHNVVLYSVRQLDSLRASSASAVSLCLNEALVIRELLLSVSRNTALGKVSR